MKFISWNVNGLRACIQKGFLDFFNSANADFFCLQETKLQPGQLELDLPGYRQYWCYAEKKGYSGTAVFTKHPPLEVRYGLGIPELDTEGRVITLEYPEFYLVTCYTPNAQRELARIEHRMKWEDAFRDYLMGLDRAKPVVLCGDLNVAHQEIDLKNPASNRGNAGFSDQEREAFGRLLESGFTDTFRYRNPTAAGCYTWWSYMYNARQNNAGWRIDYFLVSDRLREAVYGTPIHSSVLGSDHCPVELDLEISCYGSIWQSEPVGQATVRQTESKPERKPISGTTKKTLLGAAAVCLLASGFAAGFFTNRALTKPDDPALHTPVAYGAVTAEEARQMTTPELVQDAVRITDLMSYRDPAGEQYSIDEYEALKQAYPVLAELETREDAVEQLQMFCFTTSDLFAGTAASNLLDLLTDYGGLPGLELNNAAGSLIKPRSFSTYSAEG